MDKCIMMAGDLQFGQKPDFVHVAGTKVVITDFDTFMDCGWQYEHRIIPVGDYPDRDADKEAYDAYDYFYEGADSGEYGESETPLEEERRHKHFAALWRYLTKEIVIFKEVA